MSGFTQYLFAFLIGGAICTVGQILISLTRLTPARVLVLFVTLGVALTGLGLYQYVAEAGGAGATVPLTGFGYALGKGAMEGARNEGIIGALTGGIKQTAAGVAAAVVFGYMFALIFKPKTKI